MHIAVSNLAYQGLFTNRLLRLPKDIGMEVYSETGSDFYWDHLIPKLMDGRTGPFSVHGPYQNINLSDPDLEYDAVRDLYIWTFALCKKYGAAHCVCHPYSYYSTKTMTEEEIQIRKTCCLARVTELNRIAQEYGVELLVENMADKDGLLDQDGFAELFGSQNELRFLIDTGHANLQNWDLNRMFEQLGDRIHGYHLNDNFGDGDSHLKVWEGSFDWDTFFAGYRRYTPQATLVCEYMNGTIDEIVSSVESIKRHLL